MPAPDEAAAPGAGTSRAGHRLALRSSTIPGFPWIAAGLAYLAYTLYILWPVPTAPGRWLVGGPGDATGQIALTYYRESLGAWPLSDQVTHLENFPFGLPLPGAVAISQLAVEGPLQLLSLMTGGNEILAYNAMMMLALVASPLAAFALVRFVVGGFAAPLLAGFAYGFSPWHIIRAGGHLALTHIEWLPLIVLGLLWILEGGGRRAWVLTGVALAMNAYTNAYFTLMAGVIVAAFVVTDLIVTRRTGTGMAGFGRRLAVLAGVLAVIYLPQGLWMATKRASVDDSLGGTRSATDLHGYGARWYDWLLPQMDHPLMGAGYPAFRERHFHLSNATESTLYLGAVVILLAVVGLSAVWGRALTRRHARAAVFAVVLMLFGVITALPDRVLGGRIPTPSVFIFPLFPYWRVYSRLYVVVALGLVILAGIGIAVLLARRRPAVSAALAVLLGLALAVDFSTGTARWDSTPPPVYDVLRAKGPGARVEYPITTPYTFDHYRYIAFTEASGRPLMNGGKLYTWQGGLDGRMRDPSRRWVAPMLAWLGVRWVVVHDDEYRNGGTEPPPRVRGARQVYRDPSSSLWRVRAAPPQVAVIPADNWGDAEPRPGGWSQWLGSHEGSLLVVNRRARPARVTVTMSLGSFAEPRPFAFHADGRTLWTGTIATTPTPVSFAYTAPPGESRISLTSPMPATSIGQTLHIPDPRSVSVQVGGITVHGDGVPAFTLG